MYLSRAQTKDSLTLPVVAVSNYLQRFRAKRSRRWLDATVILFEGLEDVVQWSTLKANGFRYLCNSRLSNAGKCDVFESWYLASRAGSSAILSLLITLRNVVEMYGAGMSVTGTANSPVFIPEALSWHKRVALDMHSDPTLWGEYLLVYTCFTFLYHTEPSFRTLVNQETYFVTSEVGYKLHYQSNWDMSALSAIVLAKHMEHPSHKLLLSSRMFKVSTKGSMGTSNLQKLVRPGSFLYNVLHLNRNPLFFRSHLVVVVSHFDEDLSWLDPYKGLMMIFNKGDELPPNRITDPIVNIRNVGRESHTYITYIIQNYHSLPEYVAFVQGSLDESHSWIREDYGPSMIFNMVKEARSNSNGCSNAHRAHIDDPNWGRDFDGGNMSLQKYRDFDVQSTGTLGQFWDRTLKIRVPSNNGFCIYPSAFMVISRKRIISRPLNYYMQIQTELSYSSDPIEGHFMERSWYHVFNCDHGK